MGNVVLQSEDCGAVRASNFASYSCVHACSCTRLLAGGVASISPPHGEDQPPRAAAKLASPGRLAHLSDGRVRDIVHMGGCSSPGQLHAVGEAGTAWESCCLGVCIKPIDQPCCQKPGGLVATVSLFHGMQANQLQCQASALNNQARILNLPLLDSLNE